MQADACWFQSWSAFCFYALPGGVVGFCHRYMLHQIDGLLSGDVRLPLEWSGGFVLDVVRAGFPGVVPGGWLPAPGSRLPQVGVAVFPGCYTADDLMHPRLLLPGGAGGWERSGHPGDSRAAGILAVLFRSGARKGIPRAAGNG